MRMKNHKYMVQVYFRQIPSSSCYLTRQSTHRDFVFFGSLCLNDFDGTVQELFAWFFPIPSVEIKLSQVFGVKSGRVLISRLNKSPVIAIRCDVYSLFGETWAEEQDTQTHKIHKHNRNPKKCPTEIEQTTANTRHMSKTYDEFKE